MARSWQVGTPTIELVALMVTMPKGLLELTPMIIEVTSVNEHIMRQRIYHFSGVISLVSEYTPAEASDLNVKDALYATLESVIG